MDNIHERLRKLASIHYSKSWQLAVRTRRWPLELARFLRQLQVMMRSCSCMACTSARYAGG